MGLPSATATAVIVAVTIVVAGGGDGDKVDEWQWQGETVGIFGMIEWEKGESNCGKEMELTNKKCLYFKLLAQKLNWVL